MVMKRLRQWPWFSKEKPYYGRITDVKSYVQKSYQEEPKLVEVLRLPLTPRLMVNAFGRAKACSLMAIDHIMGYDTGVEDDATRRAKINAMARRCLYFPGRGTPVATMGILWRLMGYRVRASFVLRFSRMERELKAGRPFILNLAWGDYPAHTVTVIGYQKWQVGGKELPFLIVADGWSASDRYIDFRAMKAWGTGTVANVFYGRLT